MALALTRPLLKTVLEVSHANKDCYRQILQSPWSQRLSRTFSQLFKEDSMILRKYPQKVELEQLPALFLHLPFRSQTLVNFSALQNSQGSFFALSLAFIY